MKPLPFDLMTVPARRAVLTALVGLLIVAAGQPQPAAAQASAAGRSEVVTKDGFRQLRWSELVPPGWDPYADVRSKGLGAALDGSPEATKQMRELRELWDKAPTVNTLNGQLVRLPGYVVPIEETRQGLKEMLLVPYFGACIHSPPPPSNQIIHVVLAKPAEGFFTMDTVWISGTLKTATRKDAELGVSGYRIDATRIERYERQ